MLIAHTDDDDDAGDYSKWDFHLSLVLLITCLADSEPRP